MTMMCSGRLPLQYHNVNSAAMLKLCSGAWKGDA